MVWPTKIAPAQSPGYGLAYKNQSTKKHLKHSLTHFIVVKIPCDFCPNSIEFNCYDKIYHMSTVFQLSQVQISNPRIPP